MNGHMRAVRSKNGHTPLMRGIIMMTPIDAPLVIILMTLFWVDTNHPRIKRIDRPGLDVSTGRRVVGRRVASGSHNVTYAYQYTRGVMIVTIIRRYMIPPLKTYSK